MTFDDLLRTLKLKSVLPQEIADLFYHLKRVGNAAAHENAGNTGDALAALKIARAAAVWFHRSYGGAPGFRPGPFVPPAAPVDATAALAAELEELRRRVQESADGEAKVLLAYQDAEAARLKALAEAEAQQRERWAMIASCAAPQSSIASCRTAAMACSSSPPCSITRLATPSRWPI
ncbi:MAG TPA: DUF4145 domain-containing protein [Acetobacteraceae bacterium]|nr:DUF4145 domain-containing protein [Acetobacteraceae bacterium]